MQLAHQRLDHFWSLLPHPLDHSGDVDFLFPSYVNVLDDHENRQEGARPAHASTAVNDNRCSLS